MKKFKFRLDQVLKYRQTIKSDRKRELLLKNQALRDAEEVLAGLEEQQRKNSLEQERILTVEEVQLSGLFCERLKDQVAMARLNILQAQEEVEKALASYIEAAKDANALETLKNRRSQEYYEHIAKEEEKNIDEMTVQRSGRFIGER